MTKFVAMYLRVSTFDQAHNGYGLGDQEVQCRKYIDLYWLIIKKELWVYS